MLEPTLNLGLLLSVVASGIMLILKVPYSKYIVVLIFMAFLAVAPPTAEGEDFYAYKTAFENIKFIYEYPYVSTVSNLTSERGFFWYMLPFSLVTDNFNYFLVLNFLFLVFLGGVAYKKLNFEQMDLRTTMLYSLPALMPLVFYWSPRSGPPLVLIIFSFVYYFDKRIILGLLFSFLASLIHSQYIPFIVVLTLAMLIVPRKNAMVYTALLTITVLSVLKYGVGLIRLLPVGDVFYVAFSKLHYIEELGSSGGIRPAGIGIIIICMVYLFFIRREIIQKKIKRSRKIVKLLDICVIFSLFTNLFFIVDSHVAGRVARFSDFFIIVIGVGYAVKHMLHQRYMMPISIYSFILLLVLYNNIYFITN